MLTLTILLLSTVCSYGNVLTLPHQEACPVHCECGTIRIVCNNSIPQNVPDRITAIEIVDINPEIYVDELFCNCSWTHSVSKLAIICIKTCNTRFTLGDNVFRCLEHLSTLKLSLGKVRNFTPNTFMGLSNVTQLDLSNCLKVCTPDLVTVLSNNSTLPKLSQLVLDGTGTHCTPIFKLDQDLIDPLAARSVRDINLSSTKVEFENFDITDFCTTVTKLNFSNSMVIYFEKLNMTQVCRSLQILDLSGIRIFYDFHIPTHISLINTTYIFEQPSIFSYVSVLFTNHIITDDHDIFIRNTSFTYVGKNNLSEVHFCHYNVLSFDIELNLNFNNLKFLNLSNNRMANIGERVFKNLIFLNRIDISHNKLSNTKPFEETFSNIFQRNLMLNEINLEFNAFTYLPKSTFSSNTNLTKIHLGQNRFEQITFAISHLINLEALCMTGNSIEFLDSFSRNSLDKLYIRKRESYSQNKNISLLVDLRGNPFSCSCQSFDFLVWFSKSPIFSSTKHLYFCQLDGQRLSMNETAVLAAKEDCEKPKRRIRKIVLLSAIPTCLVLISLAVIIYVFKQRNQRLRRKRLEDRIRLLQDGDIGVQFLVFLSFCSGDDRFVEQNVRLPLTHGLETRTGIHRDLVCLADRHFRPGRTIFSEIIKSLNESAVFIAVLSRNYCNSDYCKLEIEQACLQRKPIILMFIEKVEEERMNPVIRAIFRKYTRVKFILEDGHYRLQPDWENVCDSIMQLI